METTVFYFTIISDLCCIENRITALEAQVLELQQLVFELLEENNYLKERIKFLERGRSSRTSHTPPSQDYSKLHSVNLRERTGNKSGGQKGHKGSTLDFSPNPTITTVHLPEFCLACGEFLNPLKAEIVDKRQVIDIPPLKAEIVEHQVAQIQCSCCQYTSKGTFPNHVEKSVQYGPVLIATVGYLNNSQYLPYGRTVTLIEDLFSIKIAEGTVSNILDRLAQKAMPVYEEIKKRIAVSKVVGSDETGSSIGGKKGWFHVWQNTKLTFIVASMNRGFATIEKHFEDGFPNTVYVSDCWAAQIKVVSKFKQICLAHLLRELKKFEEVLACQWSIEFKTILKESIALKKTLTPWEYRNNEQSKKLKQRLKTQLEKKPETDNPKVKTFLKRMIKYEDYILTFLEHKGIPPDNNGSERAIRNIKVKTKVSTNFRSEKGAERFAILRSVTDTANKNNQSVFNAFLQLAKY